ncbi:Lrp/AsnC family transcriptional regulator [Exiguobacterium alkaliphilum]|uniref:Lrp/AsnC family transcriptional regulator n=1 Tax=Exiguobacterium alkaliphilum TaxID=1428684 RepID=UPI003464A3A9
MLKIDETDRLLLDELTKDSRLSMSELGRRINLSAPSVGERVRRLESFGVIKGYTIELDHDLLGQPIHCLIEATVKNGNYEAFTRFLQAYQNIAFCYRVSGDACFLLKMRFTTFAEAEQFIDDAIPYAHTKTTFVFSEVDIKNG